MFFADYGIFLSSSASLDYAAQNAYVLDLSCKDGYDDTTGIYTVYLIQNEVSDLVCHMNFIKLFFLFYI